ncbi:MAG: AAA family ATPase [Syntrophomonadaceae bacterium]|nr:AAA family ATPase [Syntrophomonadaceae bacterium]
MEPLKGIIGQERATRSLKFALDIDIQGYNIYLAGSFGTGKTTLAAEMVKEKAQKEGVPPDWCYVYNFKNPDSPRAISLPAGQGLKLKKAVAAGIEAIVEQIAKAFGSQDYVQQKNQILNQFMEETNNRYLQLEEEARTYGFTISRDQSGITSVPIKNGEQLSQEEYLLMSEEERQKLMTSSAIVQEKLTEALHGYREGEKSVKEKVAQLEKQIARQVSAPYFEEMALNFAGIDEVLEYLDEMQEDLLLNVDAFIRPDEKGINAFFRFDRREPLQKYQVNLFIDNSELQHAPVVYEPNPNLANLFGQVLYENEFGILATDYSKIKAGALHRSNGGYLILHVWDLIKNFYVWDGLKRVLKNEEITIESLGRMMGITSTESLQPQPIPARIKVILIGEAIYYYLIYAQDEEFQKLFKMRADFDTEMPRSRKHVYEYAQFIGSVCNEKNLRHFDAEAVAAVVDYSSRMAEDQNKLSASFNKLVEIIYEADAWAKTARSPVIKSQHVQKAITEKHYRSSMIEDRVHEHIVGSRLLIDVDGAKIGQINGLAVFDLGDYFFGRPVRITAKTFMGEKGLVNIEREVRLSGTIHSKGVLTLSGYMGAQYAQDKPLSISASLTFEQSYSGIDGDSASSAELYALLSSLAEAPVYQGIAVTGSVNQNGEIQPVGGVNQKIEGFFKTCQAMGLNGKQGVIIPIQNVAQLMLDEEVVKAIGLKQFHLWAVSHIDQGLEILTGKEAGVKDEWGLYPVDSIHYLVDQKLQNWNEQRQNVNAGEKRNLTAARVHRSQRRRNP